MTTTGQFLGSSGPPTASGPVRYDVDPDQVGSLASGLRRVHATIEGIGRLDAPTADLGSAEVAAALGDLNRSWSIARSRLLHELDGLAQAAGAAARAYATVDGNASAALAGSVGTDR